MKLPRSLSQGNLGQGVARLLVLLISAGLALAVGHGRADRAAANEAAWETLRAGGSVAMMRHAQAPGVGDPANFSLDDCATQRNLSGAGRAQAARIGDAFRANGVAVDLVLTSGWCRCVDTARLAFGAAEVWPALHSFFRDSTTERVQIEETRAGVAAWTGPGTLVLVTHQVNVTALTGIFPAEGEVIVLTPAPDRPAGFVVAGRVAIP